MANNLSKALLFDLGGVLIDVDFGRALNAWSAISPWSPSELRRMFRFDAKYECHERGEIEAHEYFLHLATKLQLSGSPEQIEEGWNSIYVQEFVEARLMVEAASRRLPCYAFTNTNASHMRTWSTRFPEVVSAFDRIFASHEMGLRKPERAAFQYICRSLVLPPESIIFFDDLPENVEGALDAGLRAVLVRGPDDVARVLRDEGALA
jgi:putative hydrolase of the HAD superfamily